MARIMNVVTIAGSVDGRGSRRVHYTLVRDNGNREVLELQVSGDRNRVRALLAAKHDVDPSDITFDAHYEE